jgi:hypothetical protein
MRKNWPEWWEWELDLSLPHLQKRMLDRRFTDVDLRTMCEDALDYRPDHEEGRYVIEARRGNVVWEVIVEPLIEDEVLLVITAYPKD